MPQRPPPRESERDLSRRFGVRSKGSPADRVLWEEGVYEKPANLDALTGSEGIDNSAVVIRPDGTLGYDGTGGGQVDVTQILNAGTLAAEDDVGPGQLEADYFLFKKETVDPTPTSERLVYQSTSGVAWVDTGSTVFRLNPEPKTGPLGSDTGVSATTPTIVAKVHFPYATGANKIEIPYLEIFYQSPDAATVDTLQAQWSVYVIRDDAGSVAVGDNAAAAGTAREQAWAGGTAGLTFTTVSGDVVVAADDAQSAMVNSATGMEFHIGPRGTTFVGGVTVALCLDLTTGGGGADQVLLAAATTMTALIS